MRSESSEKGKKSQNQEFKVVLNTFYGNHSEFETKKQIIYILCFLFFFTLLVAKVINASP